jgi:signal transduction histidine kinase
MGSTSGWSIKTTSVALLAAFALMLSGVYGGFTIFLVRREAAAAHDRLQQTARLVSAEIDAHLASGEQRLATVAGLPGLVHGLQRLEEARGEGYIPPWTTLHYLFFNSPVFTGGVFLLDRSGTVLWTEPPGLPWLGANLAGEPSIAALFRDPAPSVSPGLEGDRLLEKPHVIVASPIEGADGVPSGFLGGVIDLTAAGFTGILEAVSTAEGRYLAVADQAGRIVSSNDSTRLLGPASVITSSDDGAPFATASLAHAPWRVIAGEPRETALAPIWQLQRVLVGVGAAMLLVAVLAGSFLMGGFVGSIERLTAAAEVMAGGDLSQALVVDRRHREVATLGRAFENMRTELRGSHAALTRRLAEREELMRLKEEFLANVSHELRTPLNVVFGYTDMLLDDEASATRRDALARIRTQAEQLLKLVGDLMTLSGLNAGRIRLELGPVTVDEVVAGLRALMLQLGRGRPITVVAECAPDLPVLTTDPLRLEQILTNLVTNAFKFTTSGSVALRVRPASEGRGVLFEVADTGIGIGPQELPYIFDEFRQVDGSMSRRHAGVGLGLALVRRLTGFLGGEVTVESRLDVGSIFVVRLPVEHPSVDAERSGRAA